MILRVTNTVYYVGNNTFPDFFFIVDQSKPLFNSFIWINWTFI